MSDIVTALKETGKARRPFWIEGVWVEIVENELLLMPSKSKLTHTSDIFAANFEPYHPKEEIRPKEAGELWEKRECPFCGSSEVMLIDVEFVDDTQYVECMKCLSRGKSRNSPMEAIQAWNARPTPEAIKNIEWVGECDNPCHGSRNYNDLCCSKCNGTGTITRQATIEEVLEAGDLMVRYQHHLDVSMIINKGRLRVKE